MTVNPLGEVNVAACDAVCARHFLALRCSTRALSARDAPDSLNCIPDSKCICFRCRGRSEQLLQHALSPFTHAVSFTLSSPLLLSPSIIFFSPAHPSPCSASILVPTIVYGKLMPASHTDSSSSVWMAKDNSALSYIFRGGPRAAPALKPTPLSLLVSTASLQAHTHTCSIRH